MSIYSRKVIITSTNTAFSTHSYMGPIQFAQTNNYWDKNNNIYRLPLAGAITWTGSFTDLKLNWIISTTTTPLYSQDINKTKDIFIVVPYSRGLSESFKNVCVKAGIQVHFKGNNTIKDLLVAPKDRDSITNKGGVIYSNKCDHPGCTMGYIGETGRNFGDRYREHLRAPSPIYDHSRSGHAIKLDSFSIVDRESQGINRTIKEAMFISQWPPLNRNLGKYQLLHIWEGVLLDMSALHLQWYPPFHPSTIPHGPPST